MPVPGAASVRDLLSELGFPEDPELSATPERVAELWASFVPRPLSAPSVCASASDDPVVILGVPFYSICAHHLLPFFGAASVAYRPRGRLLGLGSVPRLVAELARRPQIQERLAQQVADTLVEWIEPRSVAVGLRARHLCVEMRGTPAPVEVRAVVCRGEADPWLLGQVGSG